MTYRTLSPVCGILRVSFKCSPIGLRPREADRGRLRRPDGPPRMIGLVPVSAPHPDTGSRILLSPLRFSALRSTP